MSKKILLVSRCAWTLYNFRSGLMRALKGRGHIVMGGGAAGDGFEARVEELGVSFTGLPVDKRGINPWADLRLFWALYRWYTGQKPDIVHHFTSKPVIYGSVAARLAKVPRIVNTITGLGSVFTGQKTTWLRRLVEFMYRFSMRFAHVTFFQNQEDLHFFLSRGLVRAGRARLLPGSGIDCKRFVPEPQNGGPFTFLMVARLLKDKGVYQFVEAARLTKRRFPQTRFQLLGGRDIRNPTVVPEAVLLEWQSQQVVTWLGEVEDVRPVIAQADVLVLPSHYREGVPRSLLEGAAMGKPLIATDSTGCREVVEHEVNGLLVPVKDAAALADAMAWMLENPDKRVLMGKAGRRKAEEEFDESIVLEQTLKVYEAETL